jgi:hypothetical protein
MKRLNYGQFAVFNAVLILLLGSLNSCALMPPPVQSVENGNMIISSGVEIDIHSYREGLHSIVANGTAFSPSDSKNVICTVSATIINSTNNNITIGVLNPVEMAFIGEDGKLVFRNNSHLFNAAPAPVIIEKGSTRQENLYYVYNKGLVPVAITVERTRYALLLNQDDALYTAAINELKKQNEVPKMFELAVKGDFKIVDEFRNKFNIDIDAENIQGFTLLYVGIINSNNSVVDGAIKNGADVHHNAVISRNLVEPIHAAVITNNKYAIQALIAAGCDINKEIDDYYGVSPAIAAVEVGNVDALKTLVSMGVDVKNARRRNGMGSIGALSYARNLKKTEVVKYLESL